ncbi:hypothetical protein F5Y11DRAFT_346851 [Daldinia sp. FL1419]|nr:hypothetical protein F5Y11DRAFT_346851 [Daldinia sp. FL1419]
MSSNIITVAAIIMEDSTANSSRSKRPGENARGAFEADFGTAIDEPQVERHFKYSCLVDMTDRSQVPALNFATRGCSQMQAVFNEGSVLENTLVPAWRDQNGGAIPPTLVTMTRLRRSQRFLGERDVPTGDVDGLDQLLGTPRGAPPSISAPSTAKSGKKKARKNKAQRRRAREAREEALRRGQQDVMNEDPPEEEDGDDQHGRIPPPRAGFDFRTPAGAPAFSTATAITTCANCNKQGHVLRDCPGPVDADGFVSGCAVHNTKEHNYDDCDIAADFGTPLHFSFLVQSRCGLPPIRSQINWVDLADQEWDLKLDAYPLTRAFSLTVPAATIDGYRFGAPPRERQLGLDPLTWNYDAAGRNSEQLRRTEAVGLPMQDPIPPQPPQLPAGQKDDEMGEAEDTYALPLVLK